MVKEMEKEKNIIKKGNWYMKENMHIIKNLKEKNIMMKI